MSPTIRTTKKQKSKDVIKTISDERGNCLYCKDNGKRIIVTLKLVAETRSRRIGIVNQKRKTFDIRRNREQHLFERSNSYGLNYHLIKNAKTFSKVRITDEKNQWLVTTDFILKNGTFLNFIRVGFELQIFIALEKLEPFKRDVIV